MTLTNPNILLDTTFNGISIVTAASVYSYTAIANGLAYINIKLTNAAGNGDYIIYLKKQWGGIGTASVMVPKTTATVATGETVIEFPTIALFLKSGDIISVWIDGLAGDSSVNGNVQIITENYSLFDVGTDYILADLRKILNASLTESVGGYLAAGLKKLLDVAVPVFTLESKNQSADNDTKLTTISTDYARRTGDYSTLTASQVWSNATRTLSSFGTLVSDIWSYLTRTLTSGGGGATVEEIWEYSPRTLTSYLTSGSLTTNTVSADITIYGYATNVITVLNVPDTLDGWFTIKQSRGQVDSESIIQVSKLSGLIYVNGQTAIDAGLTGADATYVSTGGNAVITLSSALAAKLIDRKSLLGEVKTKTNTNIITIVSQFDTDIENAITRTI